MRNGAKRYLNNPYSFRTFVKDVRCKVKLLRTGSTMGKHFDILSDSLSGIYLVQVKGSDGKEDHCVTVSHGWIFDSNFPNALPRTKESFDKCCSSDEVASEFVSCINVEHFPKIICP